MLSKAISLFKCKLQEQTLFSISIAGLLLSIIIVLDVLFNLFIGFGGFSIQMFLVVYALGICLIPNLFVTFCFIFVTPAILFGFEPNLYIISPMQVFIEYFLAFYIFYLMRIARIIINKFKNKKKRTYFEIMIIISFYTLCITIKFILHSIATYVYWNFTWVGAITFNALGSLANSAVSIPFLIIVLPPFIYLKNKHQLNSLSKW